MEISKQEIEFTPDLEYKFAKYYDLIKIFWSEKPSGIYINLNLILDSSVFNGSLEFSKTNSINLDDIKGISLRDNLYYIGFLLDEKFLTYDIETLLKIYDYHNSNKIMNYIKSIMNKYMYESLQYRFIQPNKNIIINKSIDYIFISNVINYFISKKSNYTYVNEILNNILFEYSDSHFLSLDSIKYILYKYNYTLISGRPVLHEMIFNAHWHVNNTNINATERELYVSYYILKLYTERTGYKFFSTDKEKIKKIVNDSEFDCVWLNISD